MLLDEAFESTDPPPRTDLAAEANHRIANSLAAVGLLVRRQLDGLDRASAQPTREGVHHMLTEIKASIDAISHLHRVLSVEPSGNNLDVGLYLQQVSKSVVASVAHRSPVELFFSGELGCRLAPSRLLYLGLIVVELVTNSIKYAHPAGVSGTIEIECSRRGGYLVVGVADDGVGLPEMFNRTSPLHSGMRLVHSLAAQIGGKIRFDNGDLGLRVFIEVPLD